MTTKDTAKYLAERARIKVLPLAEQLRACADLVAHGGQTESAISEMLIAEIGARLRARRLGRADAIADSREQPSIHDWYVPDGYVYPICRVCGVVQRRDGKNKPCKGPTRLRDMEK